MLLRNVITKFLIYIFKYNYEQFFHFFEHTHTHTYILLFPSKKINYKILILDNVTTVMCKDDSIISKYVLNICYIKQIKLIKR